MTISCPPSRYAHIHFLFLQNTGENTAMAWPSRGGKYAIHAQAHMTGFNGVFHMFSIAVQIYSCLKQGHTLSEMKKQTYRETTMGVPKGYIRLTFSLFYPSFNWMPLMSTLM